MRTPSGPFAGPNLLARRRDLLERRAPGRSLRRGGLGSRRPSPCRSPMTATTSPTFAVAPGPTRISVSRPATIACTSIVTLSVSTSKRLSPSLDLVADRLEPGEDLALRNRLAELRHDDRRGHGVYPFSTRRTLSTMRAALGSARSSRWSAAGKGMCGVVMRTIGPSRSQKASSATIEAISAPQPQSRGFSSTVKSRPVFATEPKNGLRVERHKRAHVDDFRVDPMLALQGLRRFERARDHQGERDDRAVAAGAKDLRRSKRVDDLAVGHLALRSRRATCARER